MRHIGSIIDIKKSVKNPCYIIFWKYEIDSINLHKFETEYGRNGSWAMLFKKSKFYQGSCLFKKVLDSDTYYLMDIWADQMSYEKFLKNHKSVYDNLSDKFNALYTSEAKIDLHHDIFQFMLQWRKVFDKCLLISSAFSE